MGGSCDGVCVQPSCEQSVLGVCVCGRGASRACLCWRGDERHLLIFQLQLSLECSKETFRAIYPLLQSEFA